MDGTYYKGFFGTDRVCLTQVTVSCVDEFKFSVVEEAERLKSYTYGNFGLWKGLQGSQDQSEMYVPRLKKAGVISEAIYSFYMTGEGGQSYVDFGSPDESIVGDYSKVIWLDVIED